MSPIRGSDAQLYDPKGVGRITPEFSNYHKHGELYTHENALQVTVITALTYYVSTGWTAGLSTGAGYVVLDAANGTITIGDKGKGIYLVKANMSFSSSKNNVVIHGDIFVDGVEQVKAGILRSIGTANAIGNANTQDALLSLVPGNVIDFRLTSTANDTVIDIDYGGITIIWIAGE